MSITRYQDTNEIRKWAIEDGGGVYEILYFYVDGKKAWQFGYDSFELHGMTDDEQKEYFTFEYNETIDWIWDRVSSLSLTHHISIEVSDSLYQRIYFTTSPDHQTNIDYEVLEILVEMVKRTYEYCMWVYFNDDRFKPDEVKQEEYLEEYIDEYFNNLYIDQQNDFEAMLMEGCDKN